MNGKLGNCMKNNRGQSMVEFAISLPVLILLLAGIMEFGLILNQYLIVTEAAREGARSAALGASDADVIIAVKSAAVTIDTGNLIVTVLPASRVRGNSATVTVANKVQIVTPLIGSLFPQNPITVTGTAVMRVE